MSFIQFKPLCNSFISINYFHPNLQAIFISVILLISLFTPFFYPNLALYIMLQYIFDFNCFCHSFSSNIFITFILLDPHCNHSASQLSSSWSSRTHLVPLILLIPIKSPFHLRLCSIFQPLIFIPLIPFIPSYNTFFPSISTVFLFTTFFSIHPPQPTLKQIFPPLSLRFFFIPSLILLIHLIPQFNLF